MYYQHPYKSSEKISELIKEINEPTLRYDIKDLKDLLNKVSKKVEEIAHISKIKGYDIFIGLHRNGDKNDNKPMKSVYNKSGHYYRITDFFIKNDYYYLTKDFYSKTRYNYLTSDFYSEEGVISCRLDQLIGKIRCNSYDDKLFRLSDSLQSCPFLEDAKRKILDILHYDILYPGELTDIVNQYRNIITNISGNLKNQTKENPEISINMSTYNNKFNEFRFGYDEGIFKIEITLL